jgi:hypothetical protein
MKLFFLVLGLQYIDAGLDPAYHFFLFESMRTRIDITELRAINLKTVLSKQNGSRDLLV